MFKRWQTERWDEMIWTKREIKHGRKETRTNSRMVQTVSKCVVCCVGRHHTKTQIFGKWRHIRKAIAFHNTVAIHQKMLRPERDGKASIKPPQQQGCWRSNFGCSSTLRNWVWEKEIEGQCECAFDVFVLCVLSEFAI